MLGDLRKRQRFHESKCSKPDKIPLVKINIKIESPRIQLSIQESFLPIPHEASLIKMPGKFSELMSSYKRKSD